MTDHLPECPALGLLEDGLTGAYFYVDDEEGIFYVTCVCERLRACEQRVRDEDQRILIKHGAEQFVRGEQIGKAMGYAAGLDAARKAVEALTDPVPDVERTMWTTNEILAAIDRLRGSDD